MNKFLIASCLLALAFGWTISASNQCSCSQLAYSADCTAHQCNWNSTSSSCSSYTCTGLTQEVCGSAKGCYYNSTACVSFTSCSAIQANTTTACGYAGCQWYSGNTCSDFSCTQYNSTNCPATCLVSGTSCTTPTSCGSYNSTNCPSGVACQISGTSCVAAQCSNFTSAATCLFVTSGLSQTSGTIQPCTFGTNCTNAPGASNFTNPTTCLINSATLYHWSTNSSTDGSCVACYGVLLQIVLAIILLLA